MELILARLIPKNSNKGDNVETFIEECDRYFRLVQHSVQKQEMMVLCLLDRDLIEKYGVDPKIKGY